MAAIDEAERVALEAWLARKTAEATPVLHTPDWMAEQPGAGGRVSVGGGARGS